MQSVEGETAKAEYNPSKSAHLLTGNAEDEKVRRTYENTIIRTIG